MVVPVQVAVRLRPPNPNEDVIVSLVPETKQIFVDNSIICAADYLFPPESSQGFIYDACLVNRINFLFEGHDIFILAFGKCNSGKSHTLFQLNCTGYNISYGVVPLAVHHIFNTLSRFQVHNYFRYSVYINFFELVNGEVHDLLALNPDDNDGKKYSLSFANKNSAVVNGVENILCRNVNEVFGCLQIGLQSKLGNKNCHRDCNSHTFFIITIYQQWIYNGGCENKVSKATFIDLGGYDNSFGDNKSDLSGNFLSDILDYISDDRPSNSTNEPYLPALLRDAFTNSSSTLLLCCLSPSSNDKNDSIDNLNLVNKIRENYYISDGLSNYVCDSATEASSQELEYYTMQQDMYVSLVTSQWMKLVANAEGLFQKLSQSGIPKEAKQQIESWLCLKQEYDECFLESPNIQKCGKSLECIEEESERNSSSCLTSLNSENEINEVVVKKIEFTTTIKNERRPVDDESPCTTKNDYSSRSESCASRIEESLTSESKHFDASSSIEQSDQGSRQNSLNSSPIYRRRKTLMPEDVNYVLSKFGNQTALNHESSDSNDDSNDNINKNNNNETIDKYIKKKSLEENTNLQVVLRESDSDSDCSLSDNELQLVKSCSRSKTFLQKDELKVVSNAAESKQAQINLIILDLEGAHERIEELNEIIRIKEEYITEMIDQSTFTNTAKAKLQKKLYKLEEEYFKTRANLIKAEKAVKKGDTGAINQIEKYKLLSEHYEKRLNDLKTIKQLAGDSAKKIFELESSLFNSKRKLTKLLKQIKREEEYKRNLEKELEEDKRKVQELEEKLSNCYLSDQSCESVRSKQIQIEEKRLKTLQESSEALQQQLNKQKYLLMKRDSFLKERPSRCTCVTNVTGENSNKFVGTINDEVREELRSEIRNLRKTREVLVEQRRKLDKKFKKEKMFTPQEERHFLECDEAIEAIDAAIEYKNEIMFGHLQSFENREDWERSDELLIERLMKLSHPELRTLFTKYFRKVIDLRESGRKLEQFISEQDVQMEAQAWKVQTLSNALQQSRIESERRLVMVHREHQEKLHLMFRQYATGETSGPSSSVERDGDKLRFHDVNKLYLQNVKLKHRVVELESLLTTHKRPIQSTSSVTTTALSIPHEHINKLPNKPAFITKVTRQKNKLIIQQQKTKKHSK